MPNVLEPKHEHSDLTFPKDFLWGSATSSFQVEGNNTNSDWWDWEQKNKPYDMRSGVADDQYNLYEQDFTLAKKLGQNAHRLSIEWARIEPTEGVFDQNEIDHYKKVLKSLKEKNMTVMLTLWHFTNPIWFAEKGGWENSKASDYFARFVEKIVPELKNDVDLWITLNEPGVYAFMSYLGGDDTGRWPPAKNSKVAAVKVSWNLARAHKKAYKIIHEIIPHAKVGIAQNVSSFQPFHKHSIIEMVAVGISDIVTNHSFYYLTNGYHDFLGINYYFHRRYNGENSLIPEVIDPQTQKQEVSDLGWEIYPEGLFDVLADLSDGIPIYITEAGIASTNDDRRTRFLIQYIQEVYRAIQAGIKIKGFFYWSLIDNFEWHRGFDPRFGLVEVDYELLRTSSSSKSKSQTRTPRPSAYVYKEIIEHNGIPHALLKLLGHSLNVKQELEKMEM